MKAIELHYLGIKLYVVGEIEIGQIGDWNKEHINDTYNIIHISYMDYRTGEEKLIERGNIFNYFSTRIEDLYSELELFINENYEKYINE